MECVVFNFPIPLPIPNSVFRERTQQLEKWWHPWIWVSAGILPPAPQTYQRMTTLHVVNSWESCSHSYFIFIITAAAMMTSSFPQMSLQVKIHETCRQIYACMYSLLIIVSCLHPCGSWLSKVLLHHCSDSKILTPPCFHHSGTMSVCVWLMNRDTLLILCSSPNTPERSEKRIPGSQLQIAP